MLTGKQIPGDSSAILQYQFQTDARVILVLEKDAVFLRLSDDQYFNRVPSILVTAKVSTCFLCAHCLLFAFASRRPRHLQDSELSCTMLAQGMPDLATRIFLHCLHTAFPELPKLGDPLPRLCRCLSRCTLSRSTASER